MHPKLNMAIPSCSSMKRIEIIRSLESPDYISKTCPKNYGTLYHCPMMKNANIRRAQSKMFHVTSDSIAKFSLFIASLFRKLIMQAKQYTLQIVQVCLEMSFRHH